MPNARVFFRLTPLTRLSAPLLLNAWEAIPGAPAIQVVNTPPAEARPKDVVLFSFLSTQLPDLHREILSLREKGVILVAGGPHASAAPGFTRRIGFHSIITGDGEAALPPLARDLANGLELQTEYNGGRGNDISNWLPISRSIRTLPPLELMRGCVHNCTYCAVPLSGPPRFRSLESVRCYLDQLHDRGARRANFISPSALEYIDPRVGTDPRESVAELLASARSFCFEYIEYGIFPSEIRPGSLNREWSQLLRKHVSHRRLTLGAQSGCPERLRRLRRGHTPDDVEASIIVANEAGFGVNLDVMVGFPDETPDELETTLNFVRRMHRNHRIHAQVHHFVPLPGTLLQHSFPSFPGIRGKQNLLRMERDGLITGQWKCGERDARRYLTWLRQYYPDIYEQFMPDRPEKRP
ncbi:MAG: TIGR04013 family B12-binding domain/radical SAM domain-containing protein [Candidatus Aminicenantes bacterium]|nr:TIGR04013 family B12-binding domain/radical SAM domain-containing protein [Candidatus Aminicenantes bacterium]